MARRRSSRQAGGAVAGPVLRALAALLAMLQRRARLPGLRAVLRHWIDHRRTLRQGLLALTLSGGVGMAAGLVLGSMQGLLEEFPGLLVLVPAAIGMRGAIFGALGSRLGTGMLTGEFEISYRRRSFMGQNVEAAAVLTIGSSAAAAVLARATAAVFDLPSIDLLSLVTVSMVGGLLSSAFILVGVLLLARTAFSRSWDMDAIGSPLITATGDIVTLPALALAALLVRLDWVPQVLGALFLASAVVIVVQGARRSPEQARRVIVEMLPVLAYASLVDVLAGTVLETRVAALVASPALLVLIPPFIANCGSLGGILAARLGSDLHLGLIAPRIVPERLARLESSFTVLFAAFAFTAVGIVGHAVSLVTSLPSPGLVPMVGVSLLGGAFATGLLVLVGYTTASATYRFGFDPDNYGIPIVTATMDLLGVLCLISAIGILGAA